MQKLVLLFSFIGLLMSTVGLADYGMGESESGFLTSLPPHIPELCGPVDNATQITDSTGLTWYSQLYTGSFTIQISSTKDFSDMFICNTCLDTAFKAINLELATTYYWRVCASNVAGDSEFSNVWSFTTTFPADVDRAVKLIPHRYALLPTYPNPFNPWTTITYHLPEPSDAELFIYNSMGQSVIKLISGFHQAGEYQVQWNGRDSRGIPVTSGLYICLFKIQSHRFTQKILLMR